MPYFLYFMIIRLKLYFYCYDPLMVAVLSDLLATDVAFLALLYECDDNGLVGTTLYIMMICMADIM